MRDGGHPGWDLLRPILYGGLAAGVLDALDAVVFFQVTPLRIFQSVASGLLGREAFAGGLVTGALGLCLHFFIALNAAAVYVGTSLRLRMLTARPIAAGLAYGVLVFLVMSQVVVPLSLARPATFTVPWLLNGAFGHALLVGLPISLCNLKAGACRHPTPGIAA